MTIESIFHEFEIVNRKSGNVMKLTGIGKTREAAAMVIKKYNFAGCDFENDYILPATPLAHYTELLRQSEAEKAVQV